MIKYRPHRGSLEHSLEQMKEFASLDEMKDWIVDEWTRTVNFGLEPPFTVLPPFGVYDIVLGDELGDDDRIGWKNVRHVCVKRFGSEDFMKEYGAAQCIGYCGE